LRHPSNIAEFWNVCTRPVNLNGLGNSITGTDKLTSRIETFFTVLPDSMEAFRIWRRLVVEHEVRGAKVHDARLAAIMQAHSIKQILCRSRTEALRKSLLQGETRTPRRVGAECESSSDSCRAEFSNPRAYQRGAGTGKPRASRSTRSVSNNG
jgi:hypothetical protein